MIEAHRSAIDSLYRISRLVDETEDPREALEIIIDEVVVALGCTSASIALINPDTNRLEIEVFRGLPEHSKKVQLQLGQGVTGWVALHGKSLVVNDIREDARYFPVKETIRSEMAVPIEENGAIVGVVNVDSEKTNAFSDVELKLLSLLTAEAGRVVSKLWLIGKLREQADQLQTLLQVAQDLVSRRDLDDLLENLTGEALKIMKCRVCALFLLEPDGQTLSLRTITGASSWTDYRETIALEDSALGTAIQRRKQVEVLDMRRTEEHHFTGIVQREGLVSLLSSPPVVEDEVIETLNAYTSYKHRYNDEEKRIFETLASLGAVAIQNARLYARVFNTEDTLRRMEKLTTLGLLAAEIAHEIRNPLTVIKLLLESLDLEYPEDDIRSRDAEIISEKLEQLDAIVTRVLGFGKSGQGPHGRYRLKDIVDDTLHLVRLKLEQCRISLDYVPRDQPIFIAGSKGQFQQAFLNLIINAIQAMPDGGQLFLCSYRQDALSKSEEAHDPQSSGRGPFACVEVTDSGPGIPSEIQHRVFDSFLSDKAEGTGLGLNIVKRIFRSHGGDIMVKATSPAGTTLKMWLPLSLDEHDGDSE